MGVLHTVQVDLGPRSYPVYVGYGLLGDLGKLFGRHVTGRKVAVVSDENVAGLYMEEVLASLAEAGYEPVPVVVPPGESSKSLQVADIIYGRLVEAHLDRGSTVASLGGGMVGDLAGFVAATFMRGVSFVQIPTSLLAFVDASVGGKVAVNHRLGKNLIGAFHQPRFVAIDVSVLATLPGRELGAGLVEAVKHGVIRDEGLFGFLEENLEELASGRASPELWAELVAWNVRIKADVVCRDEREESGLRMILNYGHTLGHALEAATGYSRFLHGEAVALGMVAAGAIAERKGLLPPEERARQDELLSKFSLPGLEGVSDGEVLERMRSDKKVREGRVRFVLARHIGEVEVRDVEEDEVKVGLEAIREFLG